MDNHAMNHVDPARLEEVGMGDREFVHELINMMIEDCESRVVTIKEAYNNESWETVGREAHSMKGASLNIGANNLATLCARIDDAVRRLKIAVEKNMIEQVEAEFEAVKEELENYKSDGRS